MCACVRVCACGSYRLPMKIISCVSRSDAQARNERRPPSVRNEPTRACRASTERTLLSTSADGGGRNFKTTCAEMTFSNEDDSAERKQKKRAGFFDNIQKMMMMNIETWLAM